LLPDSLLAKSVRLGITRMLAPHKVINALLESDSAKALQFAGVLLSCCYPAKWGDQQPDDAQVFAMMERMLDRVVATLTEKQMWTLSEGLEVVDSKAPAILALRALLVTRYAATFSRFENRWRIQN
jgi:hypothetical protein